MDAADQVVANQNLVDIVGFNHSYCDFFIGLESRCHA